MKPKTAPLFLLVFVLCFSASNAQAESTELSPEHIKQTIRNFSKAVQAKDTSLLSESVSPHFALSIDTWPVSRSYMQTIFQNMTIDSIVPIDGKIMAKRGRFKQKTEAMVFVNGREPIKTNITFDARNGKILYVDYFDNLYSMHRNRPSQLAAILPFEEESSGAIIVQIKINDHPEPLRFLFDTGADGMAISEEAAEKAGVRANRQQGAHVVGGQRQILVSQGNTVHIDTLKLLQQNMAIFEKVRDGIDGLLGINLARNHIIRVNFDEKKIFIYTFGDYDYGSEGEVEYITRPSGILHIPGFLNLTGNRITEGNFVFDTGAEYYFMGFAPFVRRNRLLLTGFKPEREGTTVSMGITTPVFYGTAHEFGFGEIIRQNHIPVTLQGSTSANANWNPGTDGSVGIRLISQYNFTINLMEKEIHFAPRKNTK